jgi:glycosyltransferase involved in cell wall biosynthesis
VNQPSVTLIIPAFNEAKTVGEVVRCAAQSGIFSQIIVVDDGSSDGTGDAVKVAKGALPADAANTVELLVHEHNQGKAMAMLHGLEAARGDIVMFIDADLIGLRPERLQKLLAPLLDTTDYTASIGVFVGGRAATTMAQKIAPFISGQRACFRKDLAAFTGWEKVGFGIETALNRYLQERNIKVRVVELENLTHRMKEEKRGALRGFGARLKMYWDILLTWVGSKFTRFSGD